MTQTGQDVDVWVGLDVGKAAHFASLLNDSGDELGERSVANDEKDLDALLDTAATFGTPALVIDQLGSLAQLVLAVSARRGVPVAYIPGLVMRRAADLYPGEAKTDPRDARVLADTARTHRRRLHWLTATDELLDQLRVLAGRDEDLAFDVTRTTNRLRDALTSIAPSLERAVGTRLYRAAVRHLLMRYPSPTALRAAGRARIAQLLRKHTNRDVTSLLDDIAAALAAQTVTLPTEATVGRIVAELAADLEHIHERRQRLEQEMEALFLRHPLGPVLVSLPGVGPRTGARILVEVGDASMFRTPAHMASYAGLAPVTRQSGTSIRSERRSRRGNDKLKTALFLAAFASLRSQGPSRDYYARKRAEGKRHTAAVMCLARRRCDVLHAMLRSGQPYRAPADAPLAA
jgi:transposase